MTLLERYRNGEHEAVWRELRDAGLTVRAAPVYADAMAVAQETMRRARQNIDLIYSRLIEIGYQFDCADTHRVMLPPTDIRARLDEFEKRVGLLPLSIRAWCEHAGSVNFAGAHPGLTGKARANSHSPREAIVLWRDETIFAPRSAPSVLLGDPLVFHFDINADKAVVALQSTRLPGDYIDWQIDDHLGSLQSYKASSAIPTYTLMAAPDAAHKARMGGYHCSIQLPDGSADARLSLDSGVTFVEYLRTSFAWGGFPGLASAPGHNAELVEFLKTGLLAV